MDSKKKKKSCMGDCPTYSLAGLPDRIYVAIFTHGGYYNGRAFSYRALVMLHCRPWDCGDGASPGNGLIVLLSRY
jgi:hypothetical protein